MRALFVLTIATAILAGAGAKAQVTGVVTSSTATVTFKPDISGSNIVYNYSGNQIAASLGDVGLGSGGAFASTAKVVPGMIAFQNGNASSGGYAYLNSQTDIDVTFTNNTAAPVTPQLESQILPAGLGVYVSSLCLEKLTSCPQYTGSGNFQSFSPDTTAAPLTDKLAGSSVDFRILSNGVTIYDLTASVDLVYDPATGANVFVDNIASAQAALDGFELQTAPGSQSQHGFNWQATDINVAFPGAMTLAPNQSATLTYQTTVQTYSRADCFHLTKNGCLLAYSTFGDPIGGSMPIKPSAFASAFAANGFMPGDPISGLTFQRFAFYYPTFQNGVLSLQLAAVPEPATWSLMVSGTALLGAVLRRRRRLVERGDVTPHRA